MPRHDDHDAAGVVGGRGASSASPVLTGRRRRRSGGSSSDAAASSSSRGGASAGVGAAQPMSRRRIPRARREWTAAELRRLETLLNKVRVNRARHYKAAAYYKRVRDRVAVPQHIAHFVTTSAAGTNVAASVLAAAGAWSIPLSILLFAMSAVLWTLRAMKVEERAAKAAQKHKAVSEGFATLGHRLEEERDKPDEERLDAGPFFRDINAAYERLNRDTDTLPEHLLHAQAPPAPQASPPASAALAAPSRDPPHIGVAVSPLFPSPPTLPSPYHVPSGRTSTDGAGLGAPDSAGSGSEDAALARIASAHLLRARGGGAGPTDRVPVPEMRALTYDEGGSASGGSSVSDGSGGSGVSNMSHASRANADAPAARRNAQLGAALARRGVGPATTPPPSSPPSSPPPPPPPPPPPQSQPQNTH